MIPRETRYAEWQRIIHQYQQSGLSQKKFCEANGLSFRQFKYYRYRLQQPSTQKESNSKTKPSASLPATAEFSPVKLNIKKQASSNKLRLIHPNGVECFIPVNIQDAVLLQLIKGLQYAYTR